MKPARIVAVRGEHRDPARPCRPAAPRRAAAAARGEARGGEAGRHPRRRREPPAPQVSGRAQRRAAPVCAPEWSPHPFEGPQTSERRGARRRRKRLLCPAERRRLCPAERRRLRPAEPLARPRGGPLPVRLPGVVEGPPDRLRGELRVPQQHSAAARVLRAYTPGAGFRGRAGLAVCPQGCPRRAARRLVRRPPGMREWPAR